MQYNFDLPKYPCTEDMWDELARESRPIVVYGMGNGADKLIRRFEKYNIKIADFFASDGFVRGHSFHEYQVKSFSQIKEKYESFVIVLSFASNRREVLDMLFDIDEKYDMYIPDMPVADESEYFDRDFYNENYKEIFKSYNSLSDGKSSDIFSAVLNYKLSGRLSYLRAAFSTKDEMYAYLPCKDIEIIVDAGAYNGDTLREAKLYFPHLKSAVAIEPDTKNFKKLSKYCEAETNFDIKLSNSAAWMCDGDGEFSNSGNRNSSVSSTASYEHKTAGIALSRIDTLASGKIDYIKYDVEGAEYEALIGSEGVIERERPALLISVYHRSRDIFSLVNYVAQKYPFYNLYMARLECVPAWELNLLAVRKDRIYE